MPKNRHRNAPRTSKGQPATGVRPAARNNAAGTKAVKAMRRSGWSTNLKLTVGVVVFAVAILAVAIFASRSGDSNTASPSTATEKLVRADSHHLSTAPGSKVTVVEFLDFECEACGAAYPGVEKLRKEYDGKINYVVRYFPLPGHRNAEPAARAVQAAANQGKFEAMYNKMFDTQATWGDQQTDHTATFEKFATEIGLDITRYRTDVTAPATAARVNADKQDGLDLGVKGTPTFFINGTKFSGQPTYDSLKAAVDKALAA